MTNAIKIFLPSVVAFIIGISITPIATHYFYKYKLWKKKSRSENIAPGSIQRFHDSKSEISTPRVGGIIIWLSVVFTIFLIGFFDMLLPSAITEKLYFISRDQTLVPLFTLIIASLLGLMDDLIQIFGRGTWATDPIKLRYIKVSVIVLFSTLISFWFFDKLEISSVYVPFFGFIELGFLFIPFFILVTLSVWSSSVIDGIDGLSGGVLASVFASFALIAFFNNQINLSVFCSVVTGGILSFLWFNIPPARFYMGETGMLGLTMTLSVIAFLTDTVLLLPIIALPLFATVVSNVLQIASRKFRNGKKVFLFAPLHHHFEAIGWSKSKVTMRYWIVGLMSAILGVVLFLIS